MQDDMALPLPLPSDFDSFLEAEGEGSAFAALRLGFPAGMKAAAAEKAREGAAAPDPTPDYPSSAPEGRSLLCSALLGSARRLIC